MTARWTQEQAIAYECARELIGHVIAIYSANIDEALGRPTPDMALVNTLRKDRADCARERDALRVTDDVGVANVRDLYGAMIRGYHSTQQARLPASLAA